MTRDNHKDSIRPKKSLGQHFLVCRWVVSAIIEAAGLTNEDIVIEIGPGMGALTRVIAPSVKRLIAVEKDERMADQLIERLKKEGIENVDIIKDDILHILHPDTTYKLPATSYKLVGNIPYYLTGRLMRLVFETAHKPSHIVFTIQKEVAERIVAEPPSISILALSVQVFGHPHIIKRVPPGCFSPPPDVESAIISISDISDDFFKTYGISSSQFFKTARLGFSHKRKLLASTLGAEFGKQNVISALMELGLSPKARPQELDKERWGRLVQIVSGKHIHTAR